MKDAGARKKVRRILSRLVPNVYAGCRSCAGDVAYISGSCRKSSSSSRIKGKSSIPLTRLGLAVSGALPGGLRKQESGVRVPYRCPSSDYPHTAHTHDGVRLQKIGHHGGSLLAYARCLGHGQVSFEMRYFLRESGLATLSGM